MKTSLEKLKKFFSLEAERGYDNRAVVGGLERMLEPWQAEAVAEGVEEVIIDAVVSRLRDYSNLSPKSRQEALEGLWNRIQKESGLQVTETSKDQEKPEKTELPVETAKTPPQAAKAPEYIRIYAETKEKDETKLETTTSSSDDEEPAALNASVTVLSGVGPRHAKTLSRLGINTLGDMLYHFPRRYDDYSQLKTINELEFGEEVTIIGSVVQIHSRRIRSGKAQIVEAIISDGSGKLRVSWFNQIWIAKRLKKGSLIVISGKIDQYLGRLVMNNPEWEPLEQQNLHTNRILPVYPLTANITQRWLRRLMHQVVSYWSPRVRDPLPENIRISAGLLDLSTALFQVHFPNSEDQLKAARHRLAFDEIFLLQLGVLNQKQIWQDQTARTFDVEDEWLNNQLIRLPFSLTSAQKHTIDDIRTDFSSGHPMNRLLQGDVGSGKTVVAGLAIAMVASKNAQTALMAPTSILAEQHYRSLQMQLTGESGPLVEHEIRLLLGSTPGVEKQEIREALEHGEIKLIIGTHALLEEPANFSDLQLAIIDEQHRFGVKQRAIMRAKGENPHLLVMTATPIPRSLALTVYGDLDLSIIDELPPGRQPVETQVFFPTERERAYNFIKSHIDQGFQAFIIYPLVQESEKSDSKAAVEEQARLQRDIFPAKIVGLLHGRMKPEEKEIVMRQFYDSKIDILVSTSVVEVGVDVPNANIMLIDGANRFGLAQLHQFRGRVGRGGEKAYCILIPETADEAENERLKTMVDTNDGFILAERDLEQRGPGEFLGTRQSGYADLRLANITNVFLIEKARRHAKAIFNQDPGLKEPEHRFIRENLNQFWEQGEGDIS
jgi:ATP-dependent DNA helicase RecG